MTRRVISAMAMVAGTLCATAADGRAPVRHHGHRRCRRSLRSERWRYLPLGQPGQRATWPALYGRGDRGSIVARADDGITSVEHLVGKRVQTGGPDAAARTTSSVMWRVLGHRDAGPLPSGRAASAEMAASLCEGEIDAVFRLAGQPDRLLQQVTGTCEAVLSSSSPLPLTGCYGRRPTSALRQFPAARIGERRTMSKRSASSPPSLLRPGRRPKPSIGSSRRSSTISRASGSCIPPWADYRHARCSARRRRRRRMTARCATIGKGGWK